MSLLRPIFSFALATIALAQSSAATMKAIVAHEYGGPEVLNYEDAPRPEPKENELLVRVIACGVNPADPLIVSGVMAKEFGTHLPLIPGYDVAGVVETTGAKVTKFKKGDAVYGYALFGGGWAEYAVLAENEAALRPKSMTFTDAAAVPMGALTLGLIRDLDNDFSAGVMGRRLSYRLHRFPKRNDLRDDGLNLARLNKLRYLGEFVAVGVAKN